MIILNTLTPVSGKKPVWLDSLCSPTDNQIPDLFCIATRGSVHIFSHFKILNLSPSAHFIPHRKLKSDVEIPYQTKA